MNTLPSATSPSRSRSDERRLLLLETTLRLVAVGGVDAVTHRRVAQAAGVPLGSTTYYFDSREHLLREAFRHYLEQARAAQSELALRRPAPPQGDSHGSPTPVSRDEPLARSPFGPAVGIERRTRSRH
ncbi:MAG: TetR/AcrR family transcriptional regulator [Planctomycetota bacterium]